MPAQRIKGQEVAVLLVTNGTLEDTITDIQDFNMELEFEVKTQGYLGEKTNRHDEVFNGVKWDMEINIHSQQFFNLMLNVVARAKRELPDTIFNITGVCSFPNGETPSFLIPDIKFGSMPFNIPSRGDYIKIKLQGEADDVSVQFS